MKSLKHAMMRRGAGLAFVSAMVTVAAAPAAHAHGGIPRAFSIVFAPDDPKEILIRSDVWGIMRSQDGGQSWQWSCAEPYGGNSLTADHRTMLLGAHGRILVASQFNGLQITDDFCNWHAAPVFGDLAAPVDPHGQVIEEIDLSSGTGGVAPRSDAGARDSGTHAGAADAAAASPELTVITASGHNGDAGSTITGGIWHSTDNGDNWTQVGTPLPTTFFGESARRAPSNPKRIYASGNSILQPTEGAVERSDDNGATWHEYLFPIDADQQNATQRLVLVDPTRPDIALIWIDQTELYGQTLPDSIVATTDAGVTWKTLYRGTGDLPGLALSPDHKTLLIAGPFEYVQSANFDDALARGQAAFTKVFSIGVWGLNWVDDGTTNGRLYGGNDNFTARGIPAYTLGLSLDRGHTFNPLMTICDIRYPSCSPSSLMNQACSLLWNDPTVQAFYAGFETEFAEGPRCVTSDGGVDAGHATTTTTKKSGCSCSTPGRGMPSAPGAALALLSVGVLVGRRKRAGSRRDAG